MFGLLLMQRLPDDNTVGPRDLEHCAKSTRYAFACVMLNHSQFCILSVDDANTHRYWTTEGWREHRSKLQECDELRNMANFEDKLVAGLADHAPEV